MNPARNRVTNYHPARVTVAILVYLPHLTGYFVTRFRAGFIPMRVIPVPRFPGVPLVYFDQLPTAFALDMQARDAGEKACE